MNSNIENKEEIKEETVSKKDYDALYKDAVELNAKYSNAIALINYLTAFIIEGRR